MAISGTDLERIEAIEAALCNLQKAVSNLMSKMQFRQLLLIKQKEIDELTERVAALELAIASIERSL
jgi:polyhydroxyalkanoate synthesis regulator phasin